MTAPTPSSNDRASVARELPAFAAIRLATPEHPEALVPVLLAALEDARAYIQAFGLSDDEQAILDRVNAAIDKAYGR